MFLFIVKQLSMLKFCVHKKLQELNYRKKNWKGGVGTRRQMFFKEQKKKFGKNIG